MMKTLRFCVLARGLKRDKFSEINTCRTLFMKESEIEGQEEDNNGRDCHTAHADLCY
jgi:hypothetical protein